MCEVVAFSSLDHYCHSYIRPQCNHIGIGSSLLALTLVKFLNLAIVEHYEHDGRTDTKECILANMIVLLTSLPFYIIFRTLPVTLILWMHKRNFSN